jgi:DNA polymerase-3 subunit gamma/tau
MAYLVLARKYRPQTFEAVSGQEHVVRTLANALKSGQLAHAFLFTGPRGVGKTTTARLLAKCLNCQKGPTANPCGQCPACVEIAEGRSLDVPEIDAASNNSVENVREIIETAKYAPSRDRFRVFIIDEVHMLSHSAFNALLKTLEEPPPHVKFILATTDVHKVPETILSRCQRFDFRRLSREEIAKTLAAVCAAEGMKLSERSLAMIARVVEGGMRDALSLLDRVRAACGESPDDAAVAEAAGVVDAATVARMGRALIERDGATLLAGVETVHARGMEMKRLAEELTTHLRNLVVAKLAPQAPLDLPDVEKEEVLAQAKAADPAQLTRLFDIVARSVMEVMEAEQPRYTLEVALLKGVFLAPGAQIRELLEKAEALAGGAMPGTPSAPPTATGRSTPPPPARPPPAMKAEAIVAPPAPVKAAEASTALPAFGTPGCAAGPQSCDDLSAPLLERWRAAVEAAGKASPMATAPLKQATLLWIRDGEVAVTFPGGGAGLREMVDRKRIEIEAAFTAHFGRPTRLVVDQSGAAPVPEARAVVSIAVDEKEKRDARTAQLQEAARKNPQIQEAARILGGEIGRIEEL